MTIRAFVGNGVIALMGYMTTGAAALSTSKITPPTTVDVVRPASIYLLQLSEPYLLVGFTVPNWLGIVFFVIALICGTIAGMNQETPVDAKFKRSYLKPFYSLGFGVLGTLFIIPSFYPDVTIWSLIMPAAFFAAIGSVVIYYVIAFFTSERLWVLISTEAHNSAPELLKSVFSWGVGVIKALVGRAEK